MSRSSSITVSAPGKIHLLGEHMVVYGKPALLATVNLRITTTITATKDFQGPKNFRKIIEPIIKKEFKIKQIPPYSITISSQIPLGVGLGSSAAISAAYIAALLSFLKVKWDLALINKLAYETEKVFHGNPSGGDNSTVVFGGLVWFRKESSPARIATQSVAGGDLKLIQPLPFSIPKKLSKNFVLINTGKPKETTKEMVETVKARVKSQESRVKKIFDDQEKLVRELLSVIQNGNEKEFIRIIREGEKNLERIGVVSTFVKSIIRKIEKNGGAAKICGGGGQTRATGILLCYHPNPSVINDIAKSYNLDYFKTALGVEGLKK